MPQVRANLAAAAVPVRLVAGHNLYEEGGAADSFFMLQEGESPSARLTLISLVQSTRLRYLQCTGEGAGGAGPGM